MTGADGTRPTELLLLPALAAQRGPQGGLVVTRKYLRGAAEYARSWPGPVTSLFRLSAAATTEMDLEEIRPGAEATGVEVRPEAPAALAARLASAAVVLAFLGRSEAGLPALCRRVGVPLVMISEYSPRTERQILAAEVSNPLVRLRRRVWFWRTERIRRAMLAQVAGLQCSGTPTYDLYRGLTPDPILFFDNRVRAAEIVSDADLADRAARLRAGAPLRLVFGGRLVAMKGVMELPKVAAALRRAGVPFRLDIFGAGPLEAALAARIRDLDLGGEVALRGVLDFENGWIPFLRAQADVFLCCHPQGDPSSTYVEVMSCGVPIAGYGNEAFQGVLARSGGGWEVPVFDAEGLARRVAALAGDREEILRKARDARDFARRHAFEATFGSRVAHLVRNSRLPADLRAQGG